MVYESLFEPAKIGNCAIKNRFAMAPLGPLGLCDSEGGWSNRGIEYYAVRAKGGVGLIHTGLTFVDDSIEMHTPTNCPNATKNPAQFIRTSNEMNERVHTYGAKIFLQLSGGFGRVAIPKKAGLNPLVAPSPIRHRWSDAICREITRDEIKLLVKKFGDGAYYAKAGNFDGIQIHAVHEGYLLDQFTMEIFNHRTDEYGGSLKNRLRIVREIVEEIKRRCGDDFPVTMRYSPKSFIKELCDGALPGEKFVELGRDLSEGVEVARLLEEYGYDGLDVDVGSYDAWWWSHPPMYQDKGLYMPYAYLVKSAVNVPVICAGRMDDPKMAVTALADGVCDFVSLGRPLLADPDYVLKLKTGKKNAIRPCLSCQEGCMGRISQYSQLSCAVNPSCAREREGALASPQEKKRVLIIGGGPAGCEAARVLAKRGHSPVLYESGPCLGGSLIAGGVPHFKSDDRQLIRWYEQELETLKVPVHLESIANYKTAITEDADAVIVATGSIARHLDFGDEMVCTADEALLGEKTLGRHVIIAGGGTVACETALWCLKNGKQVTMIVRGAEILWHNGPSCHANSDMLKKLVYSKGARVIKQAHIVRAQNGVVAISTAEGEQSISADNVILAIGRESRRELFDKLDAEGVETYLIGDARNASNIMNAIWDAYELARSL